MSLETQHFELNRTLLRAIGVWPYEQSKFSRFQLMFLLSILISNIILQFTILLMLEYTTDLLIKIVSFVSFLASSAIHYSSFYINSKTVKNLLEKSIHIWDELKDDNEIAIIEMYGNSGKRYTVALSMLAMVGVASFISLSMWPFILDIVFPINESRSYISMQIDIEYFVDRRKFFYLILMHTNVSFFIATFGLLAIGTMFIVWNRYTCGLFRIASYRIENAMRRDILRKINQKNENLIYRNLIYAIDIHRKAIDFAESQRTGFTMMFLFVLTVIVFSLSLYLLQIFQLLVRGSGITEFIMPVVYLAIQYVYLFAANYFSQDILDHNNNVFATVYDVRWYIAPLHTQKLLLFVLQRGTQPYTISLAGVFMASLEGFAMLAKASVSYFTVFYSMR